MKIDSTLRMDAENVMIRGNSATRELVEGDSVETLQQRIERSGPLDEGEALWIAWQLTGVLEASDATSLSPSRLIIDPSGRVEAIPSSACDAEGHTLLHDAAGEVWGLDFSSPEELRGDASTPTSRFYALGCTLWYLLKGRPPFRGSIASRIGAHLYVPPPFEDLAEAQPEFVDLIAVLLTKEPAFRPASATQIRAEVERCILRRATARTEAPADPCPTTPERSRLRKHAWRAAEVAAGLALAALIHRIATESHGGRPEPERRPGIVGLHIEMEARP
jgi:serine/threonine protein kinase